MEKSENKGARSYRGEVIGDSMAITINFKWLIQILVATSMVVYSFWKIENRIQELERNMELALQEIEINDLERKEAEQKHIMEIQKQLEWYEQELNLNPLSWGKNKKRKKYGVSDGLVDE